MPVRDARLLCMPMMHFDEHWPLGLDAGLGGAALALGAHRVVFLYLVALLHLPSLDLFVLITVHLYHPL
jgi:hypothetical protein